MLTGIVSLSGVLVIALIGGLAGMIVLLVILRRDDRAFTATHREATHIFYFFADRYAAPPHGDEPAMPRRVADEAPDQWSLR